MRSKLATKFSSSGYTVELAQSPAMKNRVMCQTKLSADYKFCEHKVLTTEELSGLIACERTAPPEDAAAYAEHKNKVEKHKDESSELHQFTRTFYKKSGNTVTERRID